MTINVLLHIYEHGGSRIYIDQPGVGRRLVADTYLNEDFASAVKAFVQTWIDEHPESLENRI